MPNTHRRQIPVVISRAVADAHGLIKMKPRGTQQQKMQDFDALLRDLVAEHGQESLCWTDLILDTLGGLKVPKNAFQQQAAKMMKDAQIELQPDSLDRVHEFAIKGRKIIAKSEFSAGLNCPDTDDVDAYAKLALSDNGPLAGLKKALQNPVPAPDANLPDPDPGIPFYGMWNDWPVEKHPSCTWRYINDVLAAPAKEQWDQYYPGNIEVMHPPSVNRITVWSDRFGIGVNEREADVPTKVLTFRTPDFTKGSVGWHKGEREMSVDLDDNNCLIAQADPGDGNRQILAVDILPGQKVALRGSGFISNTAEVRAHYFPWDSDVVDAEGVLLPDNENVSSVSGWDQTTIDVHGSGEETTLESQTPTTYSKDLIVFDWPEVASNPGLYRLTFEFDNPTGKTVRVSVDEGTCLLDLDTRAITAELWFAVLPVLSPVRARVRATRVQCIELTHPQWWPDTLQYGATGLVQKFNFTPDGPVGFEDAQANVVSNDYLFFSPGSWTPAPVLQPVPAGTEAPPTLELHDVVFLRLTADEIVSDFDKGILTVLAFITAIVLAAILVVLVSAITAIVVAIIGVSFGSAIPLLVPIISSLMAGVLLGFAGAVGAIYASIPTVDHIGEVITAVQGIELAHILSPARFHQMLFTGQRPDPGIMAELVYSSTAFDGLLREQYDCKAFGGHYRLEATVQPAVAG